MIPIGKDMTKCNEIACSSTSYTLFRFLWRDTKTHHREVVAGVSPITVSLDLSAELFYELLR
jgi:hypothetical protein